MIMPFEECFDGIWEVVIKSTVEGAGDACLRADDIFKPGSILADIVDAIRTADYIIADLTRQNPNVYYELGFAHALNKPVILLTSDISTLPFDVKQQRVIEYTDTASGAAELRDTLRKYMDKV